MRRLTALGLTLLAAACSIYTPPAASGVGGTGGHDSTSSTGSADGGAAGAGGSTGGDAGQGGAGGGYPPEGGALDAEIDAPERDMSVEPPESGRPEAGGTGAADVGTDRTAIDAMDATVSIDVGAPDVGPDRIGDGAGGSTCAGYALQFGGFAGYARVNRPVQDDFTLEAWIKTATASLTGSNFWNGNGLLYADATGDSNDYGTAILSNKFAFGVGNPNTTVTSTSVVTTGQWVHVAATRRESTGEIQVFVNGTMEGSKIVAMQVGALSAQTNLTIGGNAIDAHYFTGLVDEVRAWNVVRSAADIQSTMHRRLTGTEPGLIGYWRFDEGSGTTTADSSPTMNAGDFFGLVNWIPSDAPVCP